MANLIAVTTFLHKEQAHAFIMHNSLNDKTNNFNMAQTKIKKNLT